MAQKKNYSRYFIILQEEDKGYSLAADKLPTGYAKLEIKGEKCKISFYVQNLKKEKEPYYMALICDKKEVKNIIKVGQLNIDDHGRAEYSFEYPLGNIIETGISMDKIIGAAVLKLENESISSVMAGFMVTEIPEWKTYGIIPREDFIQEDSEIKEEIKEEEIQKLDIEKNKFDEYEDMIEQVKASENNIDSNSENQRITDSGINPSIEDADNSAEWQSPDLVQDTIPQAELRHKKHNKQEEKTENTSSSYCNTDIDYPVGSAAGFFKGVLKDFDDEREICGEIKKCKWFKIPAESLENISDTSDYDRYTVVYYPMIGYYPYIRKHRHYIMGLKYNKEGKMKYLVYGIPGSRSIADQPFGGKSGFVTWVKGDFRETGEDGFGYWLMFYDFRNSSIVIPVK